MTALHLAAGLAFATAAGHSYLSERLFLRPLRAESASGGVFADERARKLATAMFHLASLCWVGIAIGMLVLEPGSASSRSALPIYAGIYAISGFGNFWAVGRPHPGGILLLLASALILVELRA